MSNTSMRRIEKRPRIRGLFCWGLHIGVDGVAEFFGFAGRAAGDAVLFLLDVDDEGRAGGDLHLVDAADGDGDGLEDVLLDLHAVGVDLRLVADAALGEWFFFGHECASWVVAPVWGRPLLMGRI